MALGSAGYVAVAKESVYATNPAAGFYTIPFSSEGFQLTVNRARSNNIVAGASYASVYDAGKFVEWSLSGDCLYNRLDHLILGVMGAVDTTEDVGAETGAHSNLFTPATSLPSFTFEISKGNIPSTKIIEYVGCMVSRLELAGDDTGALRFTASGFGKDETSASGGDTPTSTTAPTATYLQDPILVQKATVWDMGTGSGTALCLKSFRLVIDRKISPNDFCWGAASPNQPSIEDFMEVTFEASFKWDAAAEALYRDYDAQTDLSGEVKFVSANKVLPAGTADRTLDIFLNNFRYDAPGGMVQMDTPGLLIARTGATVYGTSGTGATSQPLAITTINNVDADSL